ncbi:hypothetical protein U9R90_31900 [Streptomyces sp. E11-3]|uniref:WxL protein peptidoglycan domain-containing protein n=1 Tax=Streptomyces sp. E11-3 TaxID=3110112 RepID=UPI00397FD8F2
MPSGPRVTVTCLLAVAGLLALPAPSSSAAYGADPDGGSRWSVAPATGDTARTAKDGRPSFYLEGAPGTVLQDTVTVTNPGDKPRTVRLRGADADNTGDGSLAVSDTGESRDSGAWITPAREKVKVPPRTRAEIPFTVTVPVDAVPGDHPGAIVASSGGRDAGVRLHLRVSGPTLSALTVEKVRVGGQGIAYDLVNRGNTVLRPKLAVRADGVFGERLDRGPRDLSVELLPGRRVELFEPWSGAAPALDSVDVKLTVTAGGGARDEATGSAAFVPWGALAGAGGGLLVVAGAALWFVRRRRRARALDQDVRESEDAPQLVSAGTGESP